MKRSKKHPKLQYTMVIQWSPEDNAYLVSFPAWKGHVNTPTTHGSSYKQAARNGRQALEMLVESNEKEGLPLPEPDVYVYVPGDEGD